MLKGQTVFELTDVRTGEVERIEETNMFTGALDNVLNGAPFYLNNSLLNKNLNPNDENIIAPIYSRAIGGLLMFPNVNDEDINLFYAPADNKPTGIASNDAYSGTDPRRGSFNEIESGAIENGYRFVWDFSTSQANGRISSVSLTSAKGGKAYLDDISVFFHTQKMEDRAEVPVGLPFITRTESFYGAASKCSMLGCDGDGLYVRENTSLRMMRMPKHTADLLFVEKTERVETVIENYADGALCLAGDEAWIVRTNGNSSGNATINIDKYSKATWEMRTESITVSAQLYKTDRNHTCALLNGYLYMRGQGNKVVEINLGNLADVREIDVPSASARLNTVGHLVAGESFIIETDDTVHNVELSDTVPMYLEGCWLILGTTRNNPYAGVTASGTILTPYLATVNNLKNPVTKTADKTMKVTYTVTQA